MSDTSAERRAFLMAGGLATAAVALPAAAAPAQRAAPKRAPAPRRSRPVLILDVKEFGARGDGKTKDTFAFQQALDRCAVLGGGEVRVPAGTFVIGAIMLGANTVLRLDEGATLQGSPDLADYPLTQVRWEGKWIKGHIGLISAKDVDNIGISGKGKILGSLEIKGRYNRETGIRHAALLEFISCRNIVVEDCFTSQNDMWSIHPTYCENVTFRNMTVNGRADGIDVDSCKDVIIDNCDFDTFDDCISLKSGRGMEGYSLLRTTENVTITNCRFKDLHWACIGIGSETSGGIRNVRVDNCKCLSAKTYAIYIKSRPGRGAFIENITMTNLEVSGVGSGFLRFNFLDSGKQDEHPVPGNEGIPTVRNFHFSNIHVIDVPTLVEGVAIHPNKPLDGFSLTNVTGTCKTGISLRNIKNAVLRDINVTGYAGPLLTTYNVTGKGLEKGQKLLPIEYSPPVAAPDKPFVLR